jgi:hypothetical protein
MRTDQHDPNDDHDPLLELFELLPPLSPAAGFADRVLRRIALEEAVPAHVPAQSTRSGVLSGLVRSRVFRVSVAFGVMATALSLLWLPELLLILGRLVSLSDLMSLGAASMVDLGRWLTVAARVGEWLLTLGGALAVSLTSPAAVKVTAACLAISGVSFVALRDLMTRNRSWRYVDPIQ